jgi:hypothetical protein
MKLKNSSIELFGRLYGAIHCPFIIKATGQKRRRPMKHERKKSNGMRVHIFMLPLLVVAVVVLIFTVPTASAGHRHHWVQAQAEPPVCWFNIEMNASEIDVGVRGFFDNEEPYKVLKIKDPYGRILEWDSMFKSMAKQGKAEFFFESGEPVVGEDDFTFSKFFHRFPEGKYRFYAVTTEGDEVRCKEQFSHVMPCAANPSAYGDTTDGVIISWGAVDQVVDAEATDENIADELEDPLECTDGALTIVGYEVIVEIDDSGQIFDINLPAGVTSVTVPPEFIALSDEFKYEVLAIEESGNQTTIEQWFCIADDVPGTVIDCPDGD